MGLKAVRQQTGLITSVTGTAPIVSSGGATPAISLNTTPITASLSGDVALNNTANYFDGPSVAQGTVGTWFVSGQVTLNDSGGVNACQVKLWDGTTVIDSAYVSVTAANRRVVVSLSGVLPSPAGNLRISVKDSATTTGIIVYNDSGESKDSTITAIRIA